MQIRSPLEIGKVRFMFVVLSLLLISSYVWTTWSYWDRIRQGNSDFIIYYTAIQMVQSGEGDRLYDLALQERFQKQILRNLDSKLGFGEGLLPYNHPPFEIFWFYGFSQLSYLAALLLWNLLSLVCFGLAVWALTSDTPRPDLPPVILYLGGLAFLPVFVTLLEGQDSLMLLLWLALAYRALRNSHDFTAGIWLSLALQKPQLVLPAFLLLVCKKRWRALAGAATGSVGLLIVSLVLVGIKGTKAYFWLVVEVSQWHNRYGVHASRMHTLRGQVHLLLDPYLPWLTPIATTAVCLGFLWLMFRTWRGDWSVAQPDLDLRFALLILVSLLVSPHLYFHDLSLLLIPFALILGAPTPPAQNTALVFSLKLAVLTFAFLGVWISYPLFAQIPVHLTVVGMAGLAFVTAKTVDSRKSHGLLE